MREKDRDPTRARRVLTLRFYGERTQREIADELDISQMHLSRLLARTLTQLRDHLVDGTNLPPAWADHPSKPIHSPGGLATVGGDSRDAESESQLKGRELIRRRDR